MRGKRCGVALAGGIGMACLGVGAPHAADLRAAKKEGKVVWYAALGPGAAREVCARFHKRRLGIRCVLHRSGTGKLYRRYLQEAKGGRFRADALHTTNVGHFLRLRKEWLRPYRPEGTAQFLPDFQTEDAAWTVLRAFLMAPFYNVRKVKEGEVPVSWVDFLDPRWKGRLALAHPAHSGAAVVAAIATVKQFGWGFYERLARQKPKIFPSGSAVASFVARGEPELALGGPSDMIWGAIRRGEPLKMFVPLEGVARVVAPNALLKRAPHPHAGRVFIDFLFGLEVQQMLADRGNYVGHPGVKVPEGVPPPGGLKILAVPPAEVERRNKSVRRKFSRIFGV